MYLSVLNSKPMTPKNYKHDQAKLEPFEDAAETAETKIAKPPASTKSKPNPSKNKSPATNSQSLKWAMRSKTYFNRAHPGTHRIHQTSMSSRWSDCRLRTNDWILRFEHIWSKLRYMRGSRRRRKKLLQGCWKSVKVLNRNCESEMTRFRIWKLRCTYRILR